jgi:hypothetical protein
MSNDSQNESTTLNSIAIDWASRLKALGPQWVEMTQEDLDRMGITVDLTDKDEDEMGCELAEMLRDFPEIVDLEAYRAALKVSKEQAKANAWAQLERYVSVGEM